MTCVTPATAPMAVERTAGGGHIPRYERRVVLGTALVASPAWLAVVVLVAGWLGGPLRWAVPLAMLALSAMLLRWHYRRLTFPLYSLSGLLEALREGDYSMRGVRGGVLGDLVHDINALAGQLQRERLQFEESTHLLSKTLAALDSAVFAFDGDSRLRLMNPAGLRLLDGAHDRLFGLSAAELGLASLLDGPADRLLAYTFPQRSGRFQVRHAALRSGGRGGRLLVINDVGRVLREEERQAWQRLLRVLGHEVNNSLAPIQSMAGTLASLAARERLPDDWREDFHDGLQLIGNRSAALARFLAGYSTLARLPLPQPRPVDLAALVAKLARLEQRLSVRVEAGEPVTLMADGDQLEQALINLMRNAVEASLPRRGTVSVQWRRESDRLCIEVIDDGPGPPPSDNLFVPFFTTKPGGSGIGLALARQIAEAHDGGVSLAARDGQAGACAQIWFPLERVTGVADGI